MMKNNMFAMGAAFLFATLPVLSPAESKPAPYTALDVVVDFTVGKKCSELDFRIFATTDKARKNLTDRTDEFLFKNADFDSESPNVKFYESFDKKRDGVEYAYENDDQKTYAVEIPPETRIEKGKQYGFRIGSITARNGADLDTWGGDVIRVNGVNVEKAGGAYGNTGNDLFLSAFRGASDRAPRAEKPRTTEPRSDAREKVLLPSAAGCGLCGICPVQPMGICLFVWIVVLLVVVVVLVLLARAGRRRPDR